MTAAAAVGESAGGAVLEFMRLMWAVDHQLQATSKRMAASLGVTGPQRLVLRLVGRNPGIAPGRLAATLHVHPSTLTGVLQRLVARGLLVRLPDPTDARKSRLSLTAKGRKMNTSRRGTVEAAIARVLAVARTHDVRSASTLLAHIARALEEGNQPGRAPRRARKETP